MASADTNMDVDEEPSSSSSVPRRPPSPVQRASSEPWSATPAYTVGYVYSIEMMVHECLTGHPEQPERISRIMEAIKSAGLYTKMRRIPIRPARREEVLLVHSEDHADKVDSIQHMTTQNIIDSEAYYNDLSLYVMQSTTRAAKLSCGGVIEATLAVARGELQKSFAIVRPPGHHAEPNEHMGFCFFNNVAVATKVCQTITKVRKVLILDWDVHHGNGTQRAFNDDPSVLYISIHRYEKGDFYPCGPFGSMESCGEGPGLGYSVNIPWPDKGMTDADYILAFQKVVMPIALEFAPDLVIISAGFDAADGDELGECHVTPTGYAHMTHMLSGLAGGKLVVALEGGYNLDSISRSALAVTRVILGESPPELQPMVAGEIATETIWQVAREQSKYWKNVDPKACEPREELERITFSIPEILKAHRQYDLYKNYGMLQVPLVNAAIEERFGTQVMCSSDLMDKSTMVVLVHEFGNLRVEISNSATCDVELEHSYHVDFSKRLIEWVTEEGHSLLDVNLFPRPFATREARGNPDELARGVVTYLWDNYIQLSNAKKVVLIGHGPGCQPLMELLSQRSTSVMQIVQAVVQVIGPTITPTLPRNVGELRQWYRAHSFLVIPTNHSANLDHARLTKRHGKVAALDQPRSVKLVMDALPDIRNFVRLALHGPDKAMQSTTSRMNGLNIEQGEAPQRVPS
ncbi:hypothetical protein PLICRDRAFT_172376 [Plicaturopsis crispa FD-325 SS-3]|nr:hypothetical protein PLICRDRAFT_172376 [Plicaturopsis crispa FD-325 SS-3]